MAKIICKECGACIDLEFNSNGVFVCPNCNKNVTCFNYDEKKVAFFNRAYAYVSEQRYELAKKAFDCLVKEFPEEAESYFGYSLAKYEINVLDSHKPMLLFRTLFSESEEFKKAISLATPEQVNVYTEVANQVDEYIKNVLKDVSLDNLKPCLTIGKDDLLINKVGKLLKSKNIQSLNLNRPIIG